MISIIETNISLKDNDTGDFQSRVVEVVSWEDYIEEMKNKKCVSRIGKIGHMSGCSLPKLCDIKNLQYNDDKLSCEVILCNGEKIRHLVYRIN